MTSEITKLAYEGYYNQVGYPPQMINEPVGVPSKARGMSFLDTLLTLGSLGTGTAAGGMYAASKLGPSILEEAAKEAIPLDAAPYKQYARRVIDKSYPDVGGIKGWLLRKSRPVVEEVVGTAVEEAAPAIKPTIEKAVTGTRQALARTGKGLGITAGLLGGGLGLKTIYDKYLGENNVERGLY